MASKNRLGQAAETSVNGFFTNAEENKPEQESETYQEESEKEPDRLKGTSEEIKDKVQLEQAETKSEEETATSNTPQEPQIAAELSQPTKNTPEEEKRAYGTDIKPQKTVMGFRAEVGKIELWKLYADAAEQEISAMCTAALDEYVCNHELTAEQKEIFDIKKQALEAEKMIKNRKKNNS